MVFFHGDSEGTGETLLWLPILVVRSVQQIGMEESQRPIPLPLLSTPQATWASGVFFQMQNAVLGKPSPAPLLPLLNMLTLSPMKYRPRVTFIYYWNPFLNTPVLLMTANTLITDFFIYPWDCKPSLLYSYHSIYFHATQFWKCF